MTDDDELMSIVSFYLLWQMLGKNVYFFVFAISVS
jgi:hypothetical protein